MVSNPFPRPDSSAEMVAVTDGNWDLTSAYICGTGSAPSADERPHFLAEFLAQRHASYAEYSVYLTGGKILQKLDLI